MKNLQELRMETFSLVKESLIELLVDMNAGDEKYATRLAIMLVEVYSEKINEILDMPHGGTFAPEELAEIILVQHASSFSGLFNHEAAASLLA